MTDVTNLAATSGTSDDLNPLIQQIAHRADLNHDGKVTGAEFLSFLMDVINSTASNGSAAPAGTSSGATSAVSTNAVAGASAAGAASSAAATGTLPPCPFGWDSTKWVDPTHTTPKYVVGRILARYPPTPAGLIQAMPALQAAMPGLTQDGDDTLNVPGVGVVDVGLSFGAGGGVGWTWLPAA